MENKEIIQKALLTILQNAEMTGDFTNPPDAPPYIGGGKPYAELSDEEKEEYFTWSRIAGMNESVPDGIAYGGSDMGTILGVSKFKSPLELYEEKKGISAVEPSDELKEIFHSGHVAEPVIKELFNRRNNEGYRIIDFPYQWRSKKWPHALANVDGLILNTDDNIGICEVKTIRSSDFNQMSKWNKGEIPYYYLLQVYLYFAVTGLDYAVIICGWGFRPDEMVYHIIERPSEDVLSDVMNIAEEFIESVIINEPPSVFDTIYTELIKKDIIKIYGDIIDAKLKRNNGDKPSDQFATYVESLAEFDKITDELLGTYKTLEKERKESRQSIVNKITRLLLDDGITGFKGETNKYYFDVSYEKGSKKGVDRKMLEETYPEIFLDVYHDVEFENPTFKFKANVKKKAS